MIEPKLRFKADDGSQFPDWEEHKIKEFVTESNILGHTGKEAKKLTVKLWAKGVVPKENVFSGSENTQYYIRHSGQLMYGKLDFLNCAFGIVPPELDGYESTLDAPAFDMHDISDKFLLCYVTRKIFYKKNGDIANGSRKAKRIHPDVFGEMSIMVPSLPEQQKIADFLSTIDTVIEKQKETASAWEERKKGVMQKLFSQEVRFKADDGSNFPEWEEKKLNEIAVRVTRKNKDNVTDIPLTISSADGLIDQRNFFNKVVASKDMSGYFLLKNGEFAYNKSYSKGYNFGSIKRLDLYDEGALSTLYICFALNKNENSDFYQKYFDSLSWYPELQKICAEGARNHGLLNVPTNDFFQLKLCVPSSDKEQHKIADCLSSLDEVIEKQKETLVAWEELKKGLLQQMFV